MKRAKLLVAVVVGLLLVVLTGSMAAGQVPSDFVADLRDNNVTFEQGAPGLSPSELDKLDRTTDALQRSGGFYKVIVLGEAVTDYDSTLDFAEAVLSQLGGTGRVQVFADDVGIASNLAGDSDGELQQAEDAASRDANAARSYAAGVSAAANILGVNGSTSGSGGDGGTATPSSSGSSTAWIWIVVILAVVVIGGFLLFRMLKKSKAAGPASTVSFGEGEQRVRAAQDRAGNLVLELADRVEQPGAPPEAKQHFQAGASEFAELQDDLEAADTRPELEAVYPRITDAVWRLECSKALLDGQPVPAKPADEPLFPAPVAPPPPPTAPGAPMGPVDVGQQYQPVPEPRGYSSMSSSPWLTTAATAALGMLAGRMMAPQRSYRPPADDGWLTGGGGGGGRGRGSSGGSGSWTNLGGSSRGGRGVRRRR